ncbi:MAG TPA: hypothetical protein VI300_15900, partial [Solirubrobacter sp.]
IVGGGCQTAACTDLNAWIRAHGVDRSRAAGEPHAHMLYAFAQPARGAAVTKLVAGPFASRPLGLLDPVGAP